MAERVRITNPDKALYPDGTTKAEVVDYYRSVAPAIVPHLRGRALTLRRFPDGVDGEGFFEKRCPSHRPDWVRTVEVARSAGEPYQASTVDDVDTLLWLANLAALELHPSLAEAAEPDRPTALVFDLDPGAPAGIGHCAEVACDLRALLGQLDLECHAKTSGSKGMQVYVALNTPIDFDTTKLLSHSIALTLQRARPELVVTTQAKEARRDRVLIDWGQNDRAKTTVCVYSLRARAEPRVSTPLEWSEVEEAVGADDGALSFGPGQVLRRIEAHGDLFSPVLTLRQSLPQRVVDLLVEGASQ